MKVLVTGSAGFIGFHVTNRLLKEGHEVVGIDSINDYYEVGLKYDRLQFAGIEQQNLTYNQEQCSTIHPGYRFFRLNLEDKDNLLELFAREQFEVVIHLAAQAGVRHSIDNPGVYISSNIVGFANILECSRLYAIQHLIFASSSSVYGSNEEVPFSVDHKTDHPVSLYGATKKSNELMAHAYSHLFGIATTGLRFFTVYGPWGRPDMACFLFVRAILDDQPIKVFNNGNLSRDFTYIDDIVEGIFQVFQQSFVSHRRKKQPNSRIYNIGNQQPVALLDFIKTIEDNLGKTAIKEMKPMQAGDVKTTYADVSQLITDFNYHPTTALVDGIRASVDWYCRYKGISKKKLDYI